MSHSKPQYKPIQFTDKTDLVNLGTISQFQSQLVGISKAFEGIDIRTLRVIATQAFVALAVAYPYMKAHAPQKVLEMAYRNIDHPEKAVSVITSRPPIHFRVPVFNWYGINYIVSGLYNLFTHWREPQVAFALQVNSEVNHYIAQTVTLFSPQVTAEKELAPEDDPRDAEIARLKKELEEVRASQDAEKIETRTSKLLSNLSSDVENIDMAKPVFDYKAYMGTVASKVTEPEVQQKIEFLLKLVSTVSDKAREEAEADAQIQIDAAQESLQQAVDKFIAYKKDHNHEDDDYNGIVEELRLEKEAHELLKRKPTDHKKCEAEILRLTQVAEVLQKRAEQAEGQIAAHKCDHSKCEETAKHLAAVSERNKQQLVAAELVIEEFKEKEQQAQMLAMMTASSKKHEDGARKKKEVLAPTGKVFKESDKVPALVKLIMTENKSANPDALEMLDIYSLRRQLTANYGYVMEK